MEIELLLLENILNCRNIRSLRKISALAIALRALAKIRIPNRDLKLEITALGELNSIPLPEINQLNLKPFPQIPISLQKKKSLVFLIQV